MMEKEHKSVFLENEITETPLRAWILLGGRLMDTPALRQLPLPDMVIAADGGAKHAELLQVKVDLWVGDFDSAPPTLSLDAPRRTFERAKDSTDGELAIKAALERGAQELVLLGAFGGRFDHTFVVVLGAYALAQRGYAVSLHSGDEAGYSLLPGQTLRLGLLPGQTLSVLAASELRGLSLSGVRWPLTGADIPLGSGWTLSNEVVGNEVMGNGVMGEAADGLVTVEATLESGVAVVTVLFEDA